MPPQAAHHLPRAAKHQYTTGKHAQHTPKLRAAKLQLLPSLTTIFSLYACCPARLCRGTLLHSLQKLPRGTSVNVLINSFHQCGLWDCANDSIHSLSALVDDDCGNAADAILCGNAWALICVELELRLHTQAQSHCFLVVTV